MTTRFLLALGFCCSIALSGCGLIPRHISPAASVIDNAVGDSKVAATKDMEKDFSTAWAACTTDSCDTSALLLKGMDVVDNRCGTYFRALGQYAQDYAYGSKQWSLTGGTAAAIEGLTGVAAKAISITGSAFSFGSASAAAYQDTYVFSPDVASVENLVKGAQDAARKALAPPAQSVPANRDDVGNLLKQYETTCEVQTIRNLVNQSINVAKVSTGANGAPTISSAASVTFIAQRLSTFTITATGTPAPTFTKGICPTWIGLDSKTGVLTANPPAATTTPETCALSAQNGITPDATQTLTIIVSSAPPNGTPPAIPASQIGSLIAGQPGAYNVVATGSAPLTFTKGAGCPTWLDLDAASGRLFGTPPPGASTQSCSVTVTNSAGNATQAITIAIATSPSSLSRLQLVVIK